MHCERDNRKGGLRGYDFAGDALRRRRDALLLRLLKMPPQSRAELAEQVRRAKGKRTASKGQAKRPKADSAA